MEQVFVVGICHEVCINFLNLKKSFKFCQRDEKKKKPQKIRSVFFFKRKGTSIMVETNSVLFGMEYVR